MNLCASGALTSAIQELSQTRRHDLSLRRLALGDGPFVLHYFDSCMRLDQALRAG